MIQPIRGGFAGHEARVEQIKNSYIILLKK
jgi:hypothetical protein